MELTVTHDDVTASGAELALSEAESAKRAARLAHDALDEVSALANDLELAGAWAQIVMQLAAVALGHSHRAVQYAPGSPAAREARMHAEQAKGHAKAADGAARRD